MGCCRKCGEMPPQRLEGPVVKPLQLRLLSWVNSRPPDAKFFVENCYLPVALTFRAGIFASARTVVMRAGL